MKPWQISILIVLTTLFIVFIASLIIILSFWISSIVQNQNERYNYYNLALDRSEKTNRPLIVIGDPEKGMSSKLFGVTYGYGDECVDIDPMDSKKCKQSDATEYLTKVESDSAIIYVSCVLEYVDDLDPLIEEMERVSGSSENLFVVHVKKYSLAAYIYNYQDDTSSNVITEAPPKQDKIKYFKLKK